MPMLTKYPCYYTNKKSLKGKEIRVIIWGRNEYDGSIQCNATSFKSLDESPDFYYEEGNIHYIFKNPCISWRVIKSGMSNHYVFDWRGYCISHQPKQLKGYPYAEIKIWDATN